MNFNTSTTGTATTTDASTVKTEKRLHLGIFRKQSGISLPLLAIYIGVAGLVILTALIYGTRYFSKTKVNNEVTALANYKADLVSYASRVGPFTAANSSLVALVNQNFFPPSMVSGTPAVPIVTNQWGGLLTTAVGTLVTAGDSHVVTETAVPTAACTELGTSLDQVGAVISINGTNTKAAGVPSNPATVGTSCGGAAGDNNTIAVTIAK
jgi:hypothetical protein